VAPDGKELGISARGGWAGFKCVQPRYRLLKRQAEVEILPMAQAENLGGFPTAQWPGGS
jgi:aryl-alcohol dehydrogenase-like predicted oxidoreductase